MAATARTARTAGVCAKLLDIMNRGAWPASLRDVAGGCLEFFAERASNLHFFPDVPMPAELDWPLPVGPGFGVRGLGFRTHTSRFRQQVPLKDEIATSLCASFPILNPKPQFQTSCVHSLHVRTPSFAV